MAFRNAIDINAISRMFEPKTQNPIEELMEGYLRPQERAIDFKSKQLAQALQEQYGAQSKEADIDYKRALTEYNRSMLGIPKSAIGASIYDINRLQEQGLISPQQAQVYQQSLLAKNQGRGTSKSELSKYNAEKQEIMNDPDLSEEEKQQRIDEIDLAIQKKIASPQAANQSLAASNLLLALDRTNLDDLTRYSGVQGQLKLKLHQAMDLMGNAPDEYIRYLKALTNAELEAKEARAMYADSIRKEVQEKLENMTNPSSWGKSPEAAKAKIQAFREILREQAKNYQKALRSTSAYRYETNNPTKKQTPRSKEDIMRDALQGKEVGVVQGGEGEPDETLGGYPVGANVPAQQPEIDLIEVRNKATGQIMTIERSEAKRLGLIK